MPNSLTESCYLHGWWDSQIPQPGHGETSHAGNGAILLPLPSFPPPLDFDPTQFTLPPSYDELADLEKAAHPTRSLHRRLSDLSTLCQGRISEDYLQPKDKVTQHSFEPPVKRHVRIYRCFRYTIFTAYQRLFTFVFVFNFIGILILLRIHQLLLDGKGDSLKALSTLASSNFLLSMFIRQDYFVSLLFRTAWLVPWSTPLWFRRMVARTYCYGGIHSGAAVAGTIWWIMFTIAMTLQFIRKGNTISNIVVAWVALLLLMTILTLAHPMLRSRYHNTFEMAHRFFGWLATGIFWMQLVLLARHTSRRSSPYRDLGTVLIHDPTLYNLSIMTALLLYPWLRLRRHTFTARVLSNHAISLSIPYPIHRFSCLSISTSPLTEWHPFATFPSPAHNGANMIISNAGDWTRTVIHHAQTQTHLAKATGRTIDDSEMRFWVKSHPKPGVLSLSLLFPRVLIITTGSGIGPALSSLLERPAAQFARLVWSARSPLKTYGDDIMALVRRADADALVLDTDDMGRPDLLEVAWGMYKGLQVDTVFVLSNEKVTRRVVGGLEGRGVRAYGPIWDS